MNIRTENLRGTCGRCRHANHGTDDAEEGLWACPWLGATSLESPCRIVYRQSGEYVYMPLESDNCTWGSGHPIYRAVPKGYENKAVCAADDCRADQELLRVRLGLLKRLYHWLWIVWNS